MGCLKMHDKDIDEQMFALEKDEEFFPILRECVKERLDLYI